ncbi:hypothetical protein [Longimicrobium terrae]|uniref:DUF4136 domain-containing protein n=1 Tax=Longimicrobium terrae TaxID=1639882 RepID=A0A841GVM8_9BACT|nr:hypothetical protein [Longimicrobium terrae]MBB4634185.1 hypothetical protein [Longimicrobium terrae]MBB6068925.1 hypothetical protein [Longimicrobium terrae]NNC28105.1 hypothetical protein [Longimicrobium terrae]
MKIRTGLVCAAGALLCACQGAATTRPSPSTSYQVGVSREDQFRQGVPQQLGRLGFQVERFDESSTNFRWITMPRTRPVFTDETGVREGEMKLVVTARKAQGAIRGDLFKMTVDMESRTRVHPDSAWTPVRHTPEYDRFAARIIQDFRTAFDTGEHLRN